MLAILRLESLLCHPGEDTNHYTLANTATGDESLSVSSAHPVTFLFVAVRAGAGYRLQ